MGPLPSPLVATAPATPSSSTPLSHPPCSAEFEGSDSELSETTQDILRDHQDLTAQLNDDPGLPADLYEDTGNLPVPTSDLSDNVSSRRSSTRSTRGTLPSCYRAS